MLAQLRRPRRKARKNLSPSPRTQRQPQCTRQHSLMIFPRSTLAFSQFQPLLSRCARCLPSKSRVLILLRTLFLSLRSFRRSPRLFSMICGLFLQNTGGGGGSHLAVHESPATNHKSRQSLSFVSLVVQIVFPGIPFLRIICVARGCGVSDLLPFSAIPVPVDGPA